MKFVIFARKHFEIPVLFSDLLGHDQVHVDPDHNGNVAVPVSAGYVDLAVDTATRLPAINASGRSISLSLASRVQDSEIIRRAFEEQ